MKVALILAVFVIEGFSFPFRSLFDVMEENLDNVADQIFKDLSIGLPRLPMIPERNMADSIHMKFIPNRVFIGRMPFSEVKKSFGGKKPGKKNCARRLLNERQSLPIPILPGSSLIAAQYASENVYPLGLLPASEAPSDTWTWVDDLRAAGQVKKLVIAGLLDRSMPSNFEPLCLVKKTETLQDQDVVLPFSFPPVMSSEGFLNEHNAKLIIAKKATEHSSSRHCLGFTSNRDPAPSHSSLPTSHVSSSTDYDNSYSEPANQLVYQPAEANSSYDTNSSTIWTFDQEYSNAVPSQDVAVSKPASPTFGFPSPPGYQLSLVNPSVYKSYGPSSSFHLIGVVPRRELRSLNGFLEVPKSDFSLAGGKQRGDLEASAFFENLWADHGLVVRVDNAQPFPASFKFVILFRADHAAKLKALNATVWPIHVQLDGRAPVDADYQLAHVPKLTQGGHEMLDNLYLLLTAVPQLRSPPARFESKSNALLPTEYQVPAYPGPAPQDAGLENNNQNSTALKTDDESAKNSVIPSSRHPSSLTADNNNHDDSDTLPLPKKPLPSKKSWKHRSPQQPTSASAGQPDLNRVAREILAFLGTNL